MILKDLSNVLAQGLPLEIYCESGLTSDWGSFSFLTDYEGLMDKIDAGELKEDYKVMELNIEDAKGTLTITLQGD